MRFRDGSMLMNLRVQVLFTVSLAVLMLLGACDRRAKSDVAPREAASTPGSKAVETAEQEERKGWFGLGRLKSEPTPIPRPSAPPAPEKIWEKFSGDKAFEHVIAQVEIGPRPAGSEALEKARLYITGALEAAGWEVERQTFTDETPHGQVEFTNIIARFKAANPGSPAPADTQRVIVASHYDTKKFSTIEFVGAHDGASSTGVLIELAAVLALDWDLAKQVQLVFFDGEEAFVQFTPEDGLYGSRHYAQQLVKEGRAKQFEYGILLDMIGDRDLTLTIPPNTPKELNREIWNAAEVLGLREYLEFSDRDIWDDHVPLNKAGIPTIDLIDFKYNYWHTADDTLDKLSPKSLEKVARITLFQLNSRRAK
jgi:glutaminyl-peptide cyclotransferase